MDWSSNLLPLYTCTILYPFASCYRQCWEYWKSMEVLFSHADSLRDSDMPGPAPWRTSMDQVRQTDQNIQNISRCLKNLWFCAQSTPWYASLKDVHVENPFCLLVRTFIELLSQPPIMLFQFCLLSKHGWRASKYWWVSLTGEAEGAAKKICGERSRKCSHASPVSNWGYGRTYRHLYRIGTF